MLCYSEQGGETVKLEYKNLQIEIKEIDENGTFKGLASPYNNVDLGDDRVLPTAGPRNNNKRVPMLWQHDSHKPVGEMLLTDSKEGIQVDGKLFLDKDEDGQYMIPKAAEAYVLIKKGILKLSIGYKTLDYEYVTEQKKTIRNLKDIEIMEVSAVTFPMNPQAKITAVKEEGGNKVEEKAMGFTEILNLRKSNELRWQLKDALDMSIRQLMEDAEMKIEDKVTQLNKNIDDFATAYKETMTTILKASATGKKEVMEILETKEGVEEIEIKAGKKISKTNQAKLQNIKDLLEDLLGGDEEEENESKSIPENKQESNKDDIIELKADELGVLEELYKNINIKEEQ